MKGPHRKNECPPAGVGPSAEGQCIAYVANAEPSYTAASAAGKEGFQPDNGPAQPGFSCTVDHGQKTVKPARAARDGWVTFLGPDGRTWSYTGKKKRVLVMPATHGQGLTQWDTLPWHTRLGSTIHAMRCDDLDIETVREGPYRHARYFLRTPGQLVPKDGAA